MQDFFRYDTNTDFAIFLCLSLKRSSHNNLRCDNLSCILKKVLTVNVDQQLAASYKRLKLPYQCKRHKCQQVQQYLDLVISCIKGATRIVRLQNLSPSARCVNEATHGWKEQKGPSVFFFCSVTNTPLLSLS